MEFYSDEIMYWPSEKFLFCTWYSVWNGANFLYNSLYVRTLDKQSHLPILSVQEIPNNSLPLKIDLKNAQSLH